MENGEIERAARALIDLERRQSVQPAEIIEDNVIREKPRLDAALVRIELLKAQGIGVLARDDPRFPGLLGRIYDCPPLLYFRGSLEALATRPVVAVVGSRAADPIGLKIAREISAELSAAGNAVVSGLAIGIDAAAHRGALDGSSARGRTIAILGNGLSRIYPSSHAKLAEQILAAGGIILSQFAPDVPPYPSNFLNRNRVIAGLALGTLVVQASLRSGSLVTARYALEEGREVLAIPGSIFEKRHAGCLELLRSGATLVRSAADIFEAIPQLSTTKAQSSECGAAAVDALSDDALRIIATLDGVDYRAVADLVSTDRSREKIEKALLDLEMLGIIERIPGARVTLTAFGRSPDTRARVGAMEFPPADKN